MRIQAPHIGNLFNYATYKGISEDVLRKYLVDKSLDACSITNTVSENEFLKVFQELKNLSADKYFGLHYGCYLNMKALGFINQLSLHSSNIQQAVFILQNYLQNSFPLVSLEDTEQKDKYILKLESHIGNIKLKKQLLDVVYCFIFRELKLIVSDDLLPVSEMPISNTTEFSFFLNTEVVKGKTYRFIFDSNILTAEINKNTTKKITLLLPKFLQMLDKKAAGYKPFSTQVRNMVLNMCCPELPTFEQVVVHFPFSNRTFQRKLTEEGFSFRKITDDIKNELSVYLSKGNKMKTQDIAYILGYSEPSAYLHAVKKWKSELQS